MYKFPFVDIGPSKSKSVDYNQAGNCLTAFALVSETCYWVMTVFGVEVIQDRP